MLKINKKLFLFLLTAFFTVGVNASETLLKKNQKLLVLGDSITQNGGYVANFDCWLQAKHADKNITVINGGLASETVSGLSEEGHAGGKFPRPDLHERLIRVMDVVKPNLIIACYGMNCGIYLPLSEDRFKAYQEGIRKLRQVAKQYNAEIVHVTPPIYDNHGAKGFNYNEVLSAYAKWLVETGVKEQWHVIDLHTAMKKKVMDKKAKDPNFTVQRDKVHPNGVGHWMMAQSLMSYFGDKESAEKANVNQVLTDKKKVNAIRQRTNLTLKTLHFQTNPKRPVGKMNPAQAQKKIDELNKIINQ